MKALSTLRALTLRGGMRSLIFPSLLFCFLFVGIKCKSNNKLLGMTADNPIVIYDYDGLKAIATHGLDKHYRLGKNIDASASWGEQGVCHDDGDQINCLPIAPCSAYDGTAVADTSPCPGMPQLGAFTGSLDGGGHTISDLYMYNHGGLFASAGDEIDGGEDGSIKNLHLRRIRVVDNGINTDTNTVSNTGGLVDLLRATIDGCSVTGEIDGSGNVGGLVGKGHSTTFNSIYNSYANATARGENVGGLYGSIEGNSRVVSSYTKGQLIGIGQVQYRPMGNGDVYSAVGGLIGKSSGGSITHNSYAMASVSYGSHQGSLYGTFGGGDGVYNSYGTSDVSGDGSYNGGLIGYVNPSGSTTIHNCFWDTETTGQSISDGQDGNLTTDGGQTTGQIQDSCKETCDLPPPVVCSTRPFLPDICTLGDGFVYRSGEYPKVKRCTNCKADPPTFHATELVGGQ